jgi:hypothetical protein
MMDWLLVPIDATRGHQLDVYGAWHGRMMVLAWAVLFPIGIIVARFFKITPKQQWPEQLDNKFWWFSHLGLQFTAGLAVIAALGLIWLSPMRSGVSGLHTLLGWTVTLACAMQFLGGWLRGSKGGPTSPTADGSLVGDHFSMTRRRRIFEYVHKGLGYIAVILACAATLNGLWLVNAPRFMWLGLSLWWICLVAAWIILQRQGLAVDTYQAIWGPDPNLPGNRMKPIGYGVRRLLTSHHPDT